MILGDKKKPKILFLIDFDNLLISLREIPPPQISIEAGFAKVISSITNDTTGEIIGVFVFLPADRAFIWGKDLHNLGFNLVACPKIKDKDQKEQDTTDARLLELGEWLIDNLNGLTHICLGSGDIDLAPLLRKARMKGLRRIIVAANIRSLSAELIPLASRKPRGGRMVYLFAPIADNNQNS